MLYNELQPCRAFALYVSAHRLPANERAIRLRRGQ
jgi:hypothetical protein